MSPRMYDSLFEQSARSVLLALSLLIVAPRAVHPQIPAATMNQPSGYPKDFCIVKLNGTYHVFHIVNIGGDQNYLGHQTSTDLYHWTPQANVLIGHQLVDGLPDGRNGWNTQNVWAPSIVLRDGVYHMFYAGVRPRINNPCPGDWIQEIGEATSTNLYDWSLALDSSMRNGKVPWALQDSCQWTYGDFRDPFVMRDPASDDWLMYYVACPDPSVWAQNANPPCVLWNCSHNSVDMVVGIAHAPSGFTGASDWSDLKPIWATHEWWGTHNATRRFAESPHVFKRTWQGSDLWFLVATNYSDVFGTRTFDYWTSPSPTAADADWTWHGDLTLLNFHDSYGNYGLGGDAYASEYFQDPDDGREYFANLEDFQVAIRQIKWRTSEIGFDLEQPFHLTLIQPDRTAVTAGQIVNFTLTGLNCVDGIAPRAVPVEAVQVNTDGSLTPIPSATSGVPETITLSSDQTVYPWTARRWVSGTGLQNMRLRLKDTSTLVMSAPVQVTSSGGGGGGPYRDPARLQPTTEVHGFALRSIGNGSVAGGVDLRIELPDAMPIRVDLFDVGGRLVGHLDASALPAGVSVEHWDARDAAGHTLAPGIYLARLTAARGSRTARIFIGR